MPRKPYDHGDERICIKVGVADAGNGAPAAASSLDVAGATTASA